MKKIQYFALSIVTVLFALTFTSCEDYFDTDPESIINEDDYIVEEDEMYKGFLGIISKVQEAGDQAIFLTDTRCNFLEVTTNAPSELQDIYNYNTTDNNEYADPTCYYAIIIACNDFFDKMEEYHATTGGISEVGESHFTPLLSSALRIKVWAYYMLGRIYGEAYWFDDPLKEAYDLSDTDIFTYCDMQTLVDKCLDLLQNGITVDGVAVAGDEIMNWYEWLDQESQNASDFFEWQYITPPSIVLEAELRSWRASYLSEDAAQSDWLWIRDTLLEWMYNIHNCESASELTALGVQGFDDDNFTYVGYVYQTNIPLQSSGSSDGVNGYYPTIFWAEEGIGNRFQVISGIIYNYQYEQRNRIVQYLCPTYPDAESFYLQPSEYGISLYNTTDMRGQTQGYIINTLSGQTALVKYYYTYDTYTRTYAYLNDDIYKIEPTIVTFRGHDLHFLIAEAENHLGNWDQASVVLNMGLTNRYANKVLDDDWSEYYSSWFCDNGGYGDVGIVGCVRGTTYSLPTPDDEDYDLTEDERKQIYDWALADEYCKEYVAEGKAYSYLCKMAERYSNPIYRSGDEEAARDSFAARIMPKYESESSKQKVRNYIQTNGYFIDWSLE